MHTHTHTCIQAQVCMDPTCACSLPLAYPHSHICKLAHHTRTHTTHIRNVYLHARPSKQPLRTYETNPRGSLNCQIESRLCRHEREEGDGRPWGKAAPFAFKVNIDSRNPHTLLYRMIPEVHFCVSDLFHCLKSGVDTRLFK